MTTTLDEGRMRTCLLPRFSALVIVLRQSASTDIRTICEWRDDRDITQSVCNKEKCVRRSTIERWRAEPTKQNQRWVTSTAITCENDGQACSRNEGSGGGRPSTGGGAVAHPCRRHCPCAPSARYPQRRCSAIDRRSLQRRTLNVTFQ